MSSLSAAKCLTASEAMANSFSSSSAILRAILHRGGRQREIGLPACSLLYYLTEWGLAGGMLMNAATVIVQGVVKADGTLEVPEKLELKARPVEITIRSLE